jgi:catechol 2,3-dioxygenase-like lactoylglutathione lyase family enzyme
MNDAFMDETFMNDVPAMTFGHIHVGVADLAAAKRWFRDVCDRTPTLETETLACIDLGGVTVALERAATDAPVTLAVNSASCDRAVEALVRRGARVIEPPATKPWGVRSAYLRGPGAVVLEVEEVCT